MLGGLNSLTSTSAGAFLTPWLSRSSSMEGLRASVDFALGVMLSAVAFSLIGPNLVDAFHNPALLMLVVGGFTTGVLFLVSGHALVEWSSRSLRLRNNPGGTARLMFAAAIILHNFPEGMGAGSSMAGTRLSEALVLQVGLAIQNVAEGALLVLCFQSMGWSIRNAIIGSILSGVVEFFGAMTGGIALEWTMRALPFCLALAGGAMLTSVMMEYRERAREGFPVGAMRLLIGMASIPVLNFFLP
ncbi:hypothetical protein EBZ80_10250 [bacterium]|nr:hypothetical protein [bacterium]